MMPITNINSHSPSSFLEDLFISATVKSILDQRVTTARLKRLIEKISNSTEELSLQGYDEIFIQADYLTKTLEKQQTKKREDKQCMIDHAIDLAIGKLSLASRKEIRNQHYGRDDMLFPGEIITDKKVKHFHDIYLLRAKVHKIENKINHYKRQQRYLSDSEDAIMKNFRRYKELGLYLKETISEINQTYKVIDGSSYQHNKNKCRLLRQLSGTTTELYYSLEEMFR